jgi:hypothetical protein
MDSKNKKAKEMRKKMKAEITGTKNVAFKIRFIESRSKKNLKIIDLKN